MSKQRCWAMMSVLLMVALMGCNDSGPNRLRLSGSAKCDGQPIPFGDVVFTPDGANAGPQGFANIRDGKFDTASEGGKGIAGGPTIIRVTGFDKQGGKLLCEYEYKADLPKDGGTFDIEAPATKKQPDKNPAKGTPEI